MKNLPQQPVGFVLSRRSADWCRLEAEGFFLVDADEDESWTVWDRAAVFFCSDLSDPSYQAAVQRGLLRRDQGVVYLQHGVTVSDQSRLLNVKRIDVMVTSTQQETAQLTEDFSGYTLTSYEVRCTGMARFDALADAVGRTPDRERSVVLVAPSWQPEARDLGFAGVRRCKPFRSWFELAEDPALAQLRAEGARIVFFLHPNLAGTDERVWEWDGMDWAPASLTIQGALVRTSVTVTDRSSVTFDAMLLGARGITTIEASPTAWPGAWVHVPFGEDLVGAITTAFQAEVGSARGQLASPLDGSCCQRIVDAVQSAGFLGSAPSLAAPAHGSLLAVELGRARVEKETER